MKTVLKNGEVVLGGTLCRTDVVVENGRIAGLGPAETTDAEIVDCSGHIVMPGVIDAHCHIKLDTGIFQTPDDWRSGSREAAMGGITGVIDFVGPMPGESLRHALDNRLLEASESAIDYTFHMTALDASPATLCEIEACRAWGLTSLKLYTTYRPNYYLDDASILSILNVAARCGLVTLIHCENDAIVTQEGARHDGEDVWRSYPERRPAIAEEEAAARVIALARYAGAKVVVAHNSSAVTARLVGAARRAGQPIYNETAPQYLFLNDGHNHHSDEAWRYILQPPLRPASHNAGLCRTLLEDDMSFVITDHCAYTRSQKIHGMSGGTPGGLPGLETLLPLTAAVPGMTWPDVARLLCENPCRIYGLWGRKGAILPGFDADIVVLKDERYVVDENRLCGSAGYSPFHGHAARGRVVHVMRRGERIVSDGQFCETAWGRGEFIRL